MDAPLHLVKTVRFLTVSDGFKHVFITLKPASYVYFSLFSQSTTASSLKVYSPGLAKGNAAAVRNASCREKPSCEKAQNIFLSLK